MLESLIVFVFFTKKVKSMSLLFAKILLRSTMLFIALLAGMAAIVLEGTEARAATAHVDTLVVMKNYSPTNGYWESDEVDVGWTATWDTGSLYATEALSSQDDDKAKSIVANSKASSNLTPASSSPIYTWKVNSDDLPGYTTECYINITAVISVQGYIGSDYETWASDTRTVAAG